MVVIGALLLVLGVFVAATLVGIAWDFVAGAALYWALPYMQRNALLGHWLPQGHIAYMQCFWAVFWSTLIIGLAWLPSRVSASVNSK